MRPPVQPGDDDSYEPTTICYHIAAAAGGMAHCGTHPINIHHARCSGKGSSTAGRPGKKERQLADSLEHVFLSGSETPPAEQLLACGGNGPPHEVKVLCYPTHLPEIHKVVLMGPPRPGPEPASNAA